MNVFDVFPGDGPVVLAQPHGGTWLPDDLTARLNNRGRGLDDTDWHITRLYDGLLAEVTVVRMNVHRYAIDANRDPSGVSLYPGQNTTSLCPVTDFDGEAIWEDGQAPSADEIAARRDLWHAPYHAALTAELDRVRARHGIAVLWDCHSIRSEIPFLFEGTLPVFNIGTDGGRTCAPAMEVAVLKTCTASPDGTTVLNGRFRGGWTTRQYGRPETGVHAIQMELAQRAYMDERAPWAYLPERAEQVRPVLRDCLRRLHALALNGAPEEGDTDV